MQMEGVQQNPGKMKTAFRSTGEFFRRHLDSAREHKVKTAFKLVGVAAAVITIVIAVRFYRVINDTYRKPNNNAFSKNVQQAPFADLQKRYNIDSTQMPYMIMVKGYITNRDSINALYSRMGINQTYEDLSQYYTDRPATLGMVLRNLRFYRDIIGSDEKIIGEISRLAIEVKNSYEPQQKKKDICKIVILEGALYYIPPEVRNELGERLKP